MVEARGITSVIKVEEITFGHLTELNGKSKCEPPNLILPRVLAYVNIRN